MLGDGLRFVSVNGASDTYLFLVIKAPNVIDVALSDSYLSFSLDEGILL